MDQPLQRPRAGIVGTGGIAHAHAEALKLAGAELVVAVDLDAARATEFAAVELEHLYGYDDSHWRFTPAPGQEHLADLWMDGSPATPNGHPSQYRHIIEAISSDSVPPVTLADAYPTMELAAAIYASAITGKTVRRGDITEGNPFFDRADGWLEPWKLEKSNA